MAFIKTRKKIVSSAIASTLSIIAVNAVAQDQVIQLEKLHSEATAEQNSLKVDQSKNNKFVAPLLDTPKSVSVISQQLIQDTQVTTLADALRTVPGITLGAGEGGNPNGDRPFIRGYSSENSMFVDGMRSSTSQNREMFAIEQVEVTKGSSSTMGGAGTVGGSINMISKLAKKGDALEGTVAQGTDDYTRITLDANKDFGNGIATRVAVMGHQNDKAGQDNGAEYKRAGIAPSITFGLDTPTRTTVGYYYLRTDDTPDSGVPFNNPFSAPNLSTSINTKFKDNTALNGNGKPIDVKQGVYYGWKDRDFQKQENHIGTLKFEHDLNDNLTLSNIATYSKSKNDYLWSQPDDSKGNFYQVDPNTTYDKIEPNKNNVPSTITVGTSGTLTGNIWRRVNNRITDSETFADQLSLSGKFNTGAAQHSFITGAEYSKQDTDRTNYILDGIDSTGNRFSSCNSDAISSGNCTSVLNPNPNTPWTGTKTTVGQDVYNTTTETASLYFIDHIELNPQWLVDLGLRWDKFDTAQVQTYGANNSATKPSADGKAPTNKVGDQVKLENNTDFFSYQAGVTFKPTENSAIYASFATSANPVGANAGDGDNNEGIAKNSQTLDPEKSRTFEVGTKWDLLNDQLNFTAAIFRTEKQNTRVAIDANTVANVGESKVDGLELGLNGHITDKWAVSAGYAYLDSELVKAAYSAKGNEGNALTNVPKNSATLWTTYALTPEFTIGAGAFASDKVYGNATNTKFVPGYVRYDAMARYNVNKNVDLQLNVNNLTDTRYFTKAYASHYATEAEGRSAVVSLNFKY